MHHFFKKFISILATIIFIFSLLGCTNKTEKTSNTNNKPVIAVSVVPEATFVKAIAGDLVDIITMIPAGKSPTNYSPSPEEIEKFSEASIYFTIGVPAEEANILPKAKNFNTSVKIISLADEVEKFYPHRYFNAEHNYHEEYKDHDHDENTHSDHNKAEDHNNDTHNHEGRDPHIWLSPKRVKVMINLMAEELGKIDKENKDFYIKNAKAYIEKLDNLDKEIKTTLSKVENKSFIVYHPSFGYFADDYDLNMIPLEVNGKESTAKELEKAIDFANERNIRVIFYQAEIDSKQSKAFAESINGKTAQIAPLAPNYIENLKTIAETFTKTLK